MPLRPRQSFIMLLTTTFLLIASVSAQTNTIQIYDAVSDPLLIRLSEYLNEDIASLMPDFLNPEVFSLAQTNEVLPEMNFEVYQRPGDDTHIASFYFDSQAGRPLPQGKLLTLYVTGNDRGFLHGDMHFRFGLSADGCDDLGLFYETAAAPRVFQRYGEAMTHFNTSTIDRVFPNEGTSLLLYIPQGCQVRVVEVEATFLMTHSQMIQNQPIENVLEISSTRIVDPIEIETEIVLSSTVGIVARETLPQNIFIEFTGSMIINFNAPAEECDQVKLYIPTIHGLLRQVMTTENKYVTRTHIDGQLKVKFISSELDIYLLYIPENCDMVMTHINNAEFLNY